MAINTVEDLILSILKAKPLDKADGPNVDVWCDAELIEELADLDVADVEAIALSNNLDPEPAILAWLAARKAGDRLVVQVRSECGSVVARGVLGWE